MKIVIFIFGMIAGMVLPQDFNKPWFSETNIIRTGDLVISPTTLYAGCLGRVKHHYSSVYFITFNCKDGRSIKNQIVNDYMEVQYLEKMK